VTTLPSRIASRDNPLVLRLRKLAQDPAAYRKLGSIWLEGEHLCSAFASHGPPAMHAVVSESGWDDAALRSLAAHATRASLVPDALFAQLSALGSPGRIGFVIEHAPEAAAIDPAAASVVLDRLQDAGNVGSILRSAAAFGLRQVIALKGTAALWSPKVLRAGMGAHFSLRLIEAVAVDALTALQVPLIATSSHAQSAIDEAPPPWPCAWVLGHEGQGVDAQVLARGALLRRIPQPGGEESLNVAAAAAICFYESIRSRS
jgi:TrmH family RNA methyltransferase